MENVKLWHGDCLEIMQEIPDNSVDMILCDLPYGITDCKWDCIIPFAPLWEQYKRIIKQKGACVLFGNQPFTTKLISSNIKDFSHIWYWHKNNKTGFLNAKKQPLRNIEEIAVFILNKQKGEKRPYIYNPQGLKDCKVVKNAKKRPSGVYKSQSISEYVQTKTGYPTTLLHFDNDAINHKKRLHPTQKPVQLLEYLIKTYTCPRRGCA